MNGDARAPRTLLEALIGFAAGGLFAVGLAVSGMTQPAKVIGFLDVAGAWDPSLAFVMLGAIAVYAVSHALTKRRDRPLVGATFHLPIRRDIDLRLLLGAALFGVGWGLAGYCPGPGLTAVSAGSMGGLTFVATMTAGMIAHDVLLRWTAAR